MGAGADGFGQAERDAQFARDEGCALEVDGALSDKVGSFVGDLIGDFLPEGIDQFTGGSEGQPPRELAAEVFDPSGEEPAQGGSQFPLGERTRERNPESEVPLDPFLKEGPFNKTGAREGALALAQAHRLERGAPRDGRPRQDELGQDEGFAREVYGRVERDFV